MGEEEEEEEESVSVVLNGVLTLGRTKKCWLGDKILEVSPPPNPRCKMEWWLLGADDNG